MKIKTFFSSKDQQLAHRKWFGPTPEAKLEHKLSAVLPETIDDSAEFIQLNYDLLKKLIDADAVPRAYIWQKNFIYKVDSASEQRQLVTPWGERDAELVDLSIKGKRLREVLRMSIVTESGEIYYSDILKGDERLVGAKSLIQEWIDEHTFYLRKLGHSVVSVHIDHVHPSLEVVAMTEEKFTSITNGLSNSDIQIAKDIAEYIMYPLTIAAIIPSGLKYSMTFYP